MTETNIQTRQPAKMDYASPVQFRFKIAKLPQVEFFIQTVNLPGISMGTATVPTPLYDYPVPGDEISFQSLDISFLVDENLEGPQGGGITLNIQGSVIGTEEFVEDVLLEQIREGLRLGGDIGIN